MDYRTIKTTPEEEYIKKQEILAFKKKALEVKKQQNEAEKKRLKELHYMCCPKCGENMQEIELHAIKIDKCFSCGGVYFDDGELETFIEKNKGSFVKNFFSFFK
jgi:hypothetical protein